MRIVWTTLLLLLTALCVTVALMTYQGHTMLGMIGYHTYEKDRPLFDLSNEDLQDISWCRIACQNETLVAQRMPDTGLWWITSPWTDRLDPRIMADIFRFTAGTTVVDTIKLNNTTRSVMKEFGVESNPVAITLKKQGNHRDTTLARYILGNKAPWIVEHPETKQSNETTYLRTDYYGADSRIVVAEGYILPIFKEGIRHLRDHRPFLLHHSQPAKIVIKHNKQIITLERANPTANWCITAPLDIPTDSEATKTLLAALETLTATRVTNYAESDLPRLPDDKIITISIEKFSFDQEHSLMPPIILSIYLPDAASATMAKATVSDRNAIFDLPLEEVSGLPGVSTMPLTLAQLRSKKLGVLERDSIESILIQHRSASPLVLRRFEGNRSRGLREEWIFSLGDGNFELVNADQLAELISILYASPVEGVATDAPISLAPYGLETPSLRCQISYANKPPVALFFGQGPSGQWYAYQFGLPTVYILAEDTVLAFDTDPLAWRRTQLLNFNRFDLQSVTIKHSDAPALELQYDHLDDSWKASADGKDVTIEINPNRANKYIEKLSSLNATSWLPKDSPHARKALETPSFTLVIDLLDRSTAQPGETPTAKTITLQLAPGNTNPDPSFYYGRVSTQLEPFILRKEMFYLLKSSLSEEQ